MQVDLTQKHQNSFIDPARRAVRSLAAGLLSEKYSGKAYRGAKGAYGFLFRRGILIASYLYDTRRYLRHSFALGMPKTRRQMRAYLTMKYHTLEKGLALSEPRPGFGQDRIEDLLKVLRPYERQFGCDDVFAVCVNALSAYLAFNAAHGVPLPELKALVDGYRDKYPELADHNDGGTRAITRADIRAASGIDFRTFAFARHSVRHFAAGPVGREAIERAVRIAQRAPSVCNRQSGMVHVYSEPGVIQKLLRYQTGNRGFGHTVPTLMVITSDLQTFASPGERFQCWIDGGLFAMTLIFGLHAEGLGTCCLNWSVTMDIDKPMRREGGIPDNEVVIMMLAVGHLPEELRVAQSPRRPLEEVLILH